MCNLKSVVVTRPASTDLSGFRAVARVPAKLADLAPQVVRLQLLAAAMSPDLDIEAKVGLRHCERDLLLKAFVTSSASEDELLLKASLARCAPDGDDNLTVMLAAALEADCARLGRAGVNGNGTEQVS